MNPFDVYAKAETAAAIYCSKHPEEDRELVEMSAEEAAEMWCLRRYNRYRLDNLMLLRIAINKLLEKQRKEEKMLPLPEETKKRILDAKGGEATATAVAKECGVSLSTVSRMWNGVTQKKTPAPVAAEASVKQDTVESVPSDSISQPEEKVKPDLTDVLQWLDWKLRSEYPEDFAEPLRFLRESADNELGLAEVLAKSDNGLSIYIRLEVQ